MKAAFLQHIYQESRDPVLICRDTDGFPLVFASPSAVTFFQEQLLRADALAPDAPLLLTMLLGEENQEIINSLAKTIMSRGSATALLADIAAAGGVPLMLDVSGNRLAGMEEEGAFVLYFRECLEGTGFDREISNAILANTVTSMALKESIQEANPHKAIQAILTIAGQYLNVCRAYIFENLSGSFCSNTYEWCGEGVEPMIQDLQMLSWNDFAYEELLKTGKLITSDINTVENQADRALLERQGIKALAILSLYHGSKMVGFVGFDDCQTNRHWARHEIQVLEQFATLMASLLQRRDAHQQERQNTEIMKTVSDHFDQIVYAADIKTFELIFVNRYLAEKLGVAPEEAVGGLCYKVLRKRDVPCDFCPLKRMVDERGTVISREYIWERESLTDRRWFKIRDCIIEWFDGREVHLEVATDITDQKQYEKRLEHYASTDTMTGILNREWGYQEISAALGRLAGSALTLCFVDIDGLKRTNDNFGHEAGDRMILQIVEAMRSSIRSSDVLCRWGGDEFLILMTSSQEQAENLMGRINAKLDQINRAGSNPFTLAFSYGLTSFEKNPALSLEELIADADAKMYRQKMEKRGQVVPQ